MRSTRRKWIGCDLLIHRKNYKSRWASRDDLPIGFIIDYGIALCGLFEVYMMTVYIMVPYEAHECLRSHRGVDLTGKLRVLAFA